MGGDQFEAFRTPAWLDELRVGTADRPLKAVGESFLSTVAHEGDEPDPGRIGAVSQGRPHILASLESLLKTGESLVETRRWPEDV